MKILEVYKSAGFIANAPVYKVLSLMGDNVMTAKHLAENDLVYCVLFKNFISKQISLVHVLKNAYGPIGNMTYDRFMEFCVTDDISPEEKESIDKVLSFYQ